MICRPCAEAADENYEPRHDDCTGCDCQHKPVKAGQIEK